jgi:hypothetical protein
MHVAIGNVVINWINLYIYMPCHAAGPISGRREPYTCGSKQLSGSYKGLCFPIYGDEGCFESCRHDSTNNDDGYCDWFKCWCFDYCASETETEAVAASAPPADQATIPGPPEQEQLVIP